MVENKRHLDLNLPLIIPHWLALLVKIYHCKREELFLKLRQRISSLSLQWFHLSGSDTLTLSHCPNTLLLYSNDADLQGDYKSAISFLISYSWLLQSSKNS